MDRKRNFIMVEQVGLPDNPAYIVGPVRGYQVSGCCSARGAKCALTRWRKRRPDLSVVGAEILESDR